MTAMPSAEPGNIFTTLAKRITKKERKGRQRRRRREREEGGEREKRRGQILKSP